MSRLLWVLEKQFDRSLNAGIRLETIVNIQRRYDLRLLTGYYDHKVQPDLVQGKILYYEGVKIPVLNRLRSYLSQIQAFSGAILSFRPDVVLFNVSNPLLLRHAMFFKKKYGTKLVSDVRTLPVSTNGINRYISDKLFSLNLRYAAKRFDGITYITERMRSFCISTYNLPLHPSAIWASGVNPELFCLGTCTHQDEPLKFMYHGSISKKRRVDNVVKALSLLNDIDLTLHLLGRGDAVDELRDLAIELGVKDRVTFLNTVEYREVPNWINCGHVGILPFPDWPGWNTSSPLKLFEYLSCGKPVVVTDIPAHRDVLHDKKFAFWAEESSPEAIAKAMRRASDERWRFESLGRAAREFVLTHHTWERQVSRLGDFLDHILKTNDSC